MHLIVYLIKQITYAFKKNTKTGMNMRQMVHGLKTTQMITALSFGMALRPEIEQNQRYDMFC